MKLEAPNIDSNTYIVRGSDLIYNIIDDEIVILSLKNEEYYYLNSIGSSIWEYISEPKRLAEIITKLTERFEVSISECSSETIRYLHELYELGIIDIYQ